MAAASTAESLQEETSCSICLDYFTDPVSLDCGHNFCRSCINQSWEGIEINFSCPQCRETSQQRNLRPNRQLANITEIAKKMPKSNQAEKLCEKHEEKLKLFCTEDQKLICLVCKEGKDHRSHKVNPTEEAVQEYKCETKTKRQKIQFEFKKLQQFLNEEQRILFSRLEEEEKEILRKIRDNVTQLEDQSSSLKKLISEIEKSRKSATELLKDVKATLSRCQTMEFPRPEAVCTEEEKCSHLSFLHQYFILKDVITKYKGKLSAERVNVSLDPEIAHTRLILSEDQKSVRHGDTKQKLPDNPQRFDYCVCVLGFESFTSGRHYWEVEVGDKTDWDFGVCKDSVDRKGKITAIPEEGYWVIWLSNGGEYKALTSPSTLLPLSVRPRAVGIFLDYEAGKVSFYNADNKSHLFTFTDTFSEKLRPYFSPSLNEKGKNAGALKIRPVPDWE
uniref:E3 ubiquitin-protein ligase TRIM39-like isoform X2 n=1 Tax=Geotrypetes seraphini TaxID=260995 RepID=A0A6P8NU00_GEOSA|nr:E3 ubiquitin-protein ligase TRIM39-like isoform X2 [Geotrypetes seraphini]